MGSLLAQTVRSPPAVWETQVRSLGGEDPLEKEMATHSSILAWKIPWIEETGGLQSTGLQRVWHNWTTSLSLSLVSDSSPGRPDHRNKLQSPVPNENAEPAVQKLRISTSLAVLQKERIITIWPSNSTPRCVPEKTWKQRRKHTMVHQCSSQLPKGVNHPNVNQHMNG